MAKLFDTAPSASKDPTTGEMVYSPRQMGILSGLGRAMTGISAPFLGDMDWAIKQQQFQQQADQADQEFMKYLLKQKSDRYMYDLILGGGAPSDGVASSADTDPDAIPDPTAAPDIMPGIPDVSSAMLSGKPGSIPLMLLGGTGGKPRFGLDPVSLAVQKATSGQMQKDQLEANKAVSRDTAIYGMMEGSMKDLMSLRDVADKEGFAGDIFKSTIGDWAATGKLPKAITDKMSQKGIKAVAELVARRNEIMTRMQPLLSEQFGKEGSNRIMESLLKMTEKELGKLSDPRVAFVGKSIGTMKNFYRFTKASADYAKRLGMTNAAISKMSSKEIDSFVTKALQGDAGKLSAEDNTYFDRMEQEYMKSERPEYDSKTQKLQYNNKTKEYRVVPR